MEMKFFCHISNYNKDEFIEGTPVEFEIEKSKRYPDSWTAINVKSFSSNPIINIFSAKKSINDNKTISAIDESVKREKLL